MEQAQRETDLLLAVRGRDVRVQVLVLEGDDERVIRLDGDRVRRAAARVLLLFLLQRRDRDLAPGEALANLLLRASVGTFADNFSGKRMTHPLDVDDLADEQARAVLQLEDGLRDALELVVLPAQRDRAPDAPCLRNTVGNTCIERHV